MNDNMLSDNNYTNDNDLRDKIIREKQTCKIKHVIIIDRYCDMLTPLMVKKYVYC